MPPRISRSSLQSSSSSKPKSVPQRNKSKAAKRSLNAFAIAGREAPERTKIRRSRLGELEPDGVSSRKKRPHNADEDEEEDEEDEDVRRGKKRRRDEDEVDEGSDSEGNEWQMGHVDMNGDDDSDIDSEEAFGESDEERFAGWTFRGSSTTQKKLGFKAAVKGKGKGKAREVDEDTDLDLDEGGEDGEGESDDESLGEDAIDLATALDQYEEDEREQKADKSNRRPRTQESEDEPSDEDDLDRNGIDDLDMSAGDDDDEDEDDDEEDADKLQDLIASLHPNAAPVSKGPRRFDLNEATKVAETGPSGSQLLDLDLLMANADSETRKVLKKRLRDDAKPSKRNDISKKLDAPLPKRQQDRLDRVAANKEANQTLGRWVDTVKQNRRAEHLSFPLQDPDAGIPVGTNRMIPTAQTTPMNDLESTIQSILVESGLASKSGKSEEERIREFEELETNKLPLEEVAKRRKELRRVRELMFREEIRAKRVKKIKSKSYRRVHRRERERDAERKKNALAADGVDVSEDEREHNDRRRAEERMGAKHRESKWAKGVKRSGRGAWDDDARAGVTEMARRNEELRRRIEGKDVREDDQDDSNLSSEESDGDEEVDEETAENRRLQRQLDRLQESSPMEEVSKLGSMMFMQKAEKARKARNDEDVERIRRELAGEETQSEEEEERIASKGRRKFAPVSQTTTSRRRPLNDFEEKPGSDDEKNDEELEVILDNPQTSGSAQSRSVAGNNRRYQSNSIDSDNDARTGNPYLAATVKSKKTRAAKKPSPDFAEVDNPFLSAPVKDKKSSRRSKKKDDSKEVSKSSDGKPLAASVSAPDADGWQTVTYHNNGTTSDASDSDDGLLNLPFVQRNQALTASAFAGDDVEAQFAEEKAAAIVSDDEKIIDNTLPGWGSWVGEGLNKKQQDRNKNRRYVTKQEGIKAKDRKDAKLERVIINEKRVKKTSKFLTPVLPHPFESRAQYERSLRMPLGPEWTTKRVFQDGTKPRVLVKQGIILPMEKPMV